MANQSKIFYKGRVFDLAIERVRLPNGKVSRYEIVRHGGSVVMIPRLSKDQYLLIHQFRPSLRQTIWEFPAGTLEKKENIRSAAARELQEEVGYRPGSLKKLLEFYPSPGLTTEKMYLFLATDLKPAPNNLDEDEVLRPEVFNLGELEKMIERGRIIDAKTIIGIWVLTKLRRGT